MTTGRGKAGSDAAGGPARHIPVLLAEVMTALALEPGATVIDGTFGAGGYSRAILDAGGTQVLAIDRDPTAIAGGAALVAASQGRLDLVEGRFSRLDAIARERGHPAVDAVVLDIGVSSMQLDEAERGFSFRFDGPLDMRMAISGESAADLVARLPEAELADLIYRYGEERLSRPIAKAIVRERALQPIETTRRLADIVARVVRGKPGDIHPATRTFQALRIAVNEELAELEQALAAAERVLRPGGRLVVVTFHSLEDRIVKQFLSQRAAVSAGGSRHAPAAAVAEPTFTLLGRKAVAAGEAEAAANPRARSAKLRAAVRTGAPAREARS
ncbi:16S rRNA (cytosine(1402)-N(4))-methyltransferase RsmH [Phreatobacter sp. AB_2022a]|uniref:16S rRNA (cytosine(1402)-N(4))-methyltransferase RsmH n=1 Tax=Phreatobacter sp. AB_2022a TaxID=3003134 RepID=UPI00228721F4|nr:16S rRNA (cytosine(1402)-N(4))-methyltransferase RsmH [Phreatobacter sp. AB_2022a]MCZ0738485.1 16S rRNA (cytosine(1402)-N(4))-methyltransferase RsmH [Phreatobacter sp. AB_2022a]